MTSWEERMSQRAKARMAAEKERQQAEEKAAYEAEWGVDLYPEIPQHLAADLAEGVEDVARNWCTTCGLPDAPKAADKWSRTPPCPRCGSRWRWHGRIADRDGTATSPPSGQCLDCWEWRRYPGGQQHFGWNWWLTCGSFFGGEGSMNADGRRVCKLGHDHHDDEVWLA